MEFTNFKELANIIAAIPDIDLTRVTEIDLETKVLT